MKLKAEAEIGSMHVNARKSVPQIIELIGMGNPQSRTPIQTDKYSSHPVVMKNIQPRIKKVMGMHLHWMRCRDTQEHFRYYWIPGK